MNIGYLISRRAPFKVFFYIYLMLLSVNSAFAEGPLGDDSDYQRARGLEPVIYFNLPDVEASDFPGESLSLQSGELNYEYTDVFIPGNNDLNIEVKRHYQIYGNNAEAFRFMGAAWTLDLPKIKLFKADDKGAHGFNRPNCFGVDEANVYAFGQNLSSAVGLNNNLDMPNPDLVAIKRMIHFENNAVLDCTKSELLMPDGRKVKFGVSSRHYYANNTSDPTTLTVQLYPSRISDRFGNYIDYTYT